MSEEENNMKNWRIATPILLMLLSAILAWTGFAMQSYLGQIVSTVNEVRKDLKEYMRDSTKDINDLDGRVRVLESRAGVKSKRMELTDAIEY